MNTQKNKEMNMIRNSTLFKGCVHADCHCNALTSKAHSIQNNRYLNKLSVNGEVLCIDFGKIDKNNIGLDRVGRKKASIFTGFCNYHDSSIFKPIEDSDYNYKDKEHNFLFAYRAFALAYYERMSRYNFMKKATEVDSSKDIVNSETIEYLQHYNNHLQYIESLRLLMNGYLDNRRFDRIRTEVIAWPKNYGISATSMFFIHRDTKGTTINSPEGVLSPFFFTIIPQNDKTIVIISYLSKDKQRYDFIKSQIVEVDEIKQKMLISNILVMYVENFFISPTAWDNMPDNTKNSFVTIFKQTTGGQKPNIGYFSEFNLFI